MIRIAKIFEGNSVRPERDLTTEEAETVILRYGDDVDFIYYQRGEENNPDYIALTSPSIDELKTILRDRVDEKTNELIFNGFSFDGKIFSLSIPAQKNWLGIKNKPESKFPIPLSTKDSLSVYILTFENRDAFYDAADDAVASRLLEGGALIQQINAMTTKEELEQFVDPR